MKKLIILVTLLLVASFTQKTYASEPQKGSSAQLVKQIPAEQIVDNRVTALENMFERYNSPLKLYAKVYVQEADRNGVDWRLLPAISGLESSFGKHHIEGTHNVYGWGSGRIYFDSWEDGISTINKALRTNYMDKWGARDVWEIGPIYAESPTWAVRVSSFMNQINDEYVTLSSEQLSMTL